VVPKKKNAENPCILVRESSGRMGKALEALNEPAESKLDIHKQAREKNINLALRVHKNSSVPFDLRGTVFFLL
jgi:hypothetical protein